MDLTPNGTQPRMDLTPNGNQPRMDLKPNGMTQPRMDSNVIYEYEYMNGTQHRMDLTVYYVPVWVLTYKYFIIVYVLLRFQLL
jgi:hypothetical protein